MKNWKIDYSVCSIDGKVEEREATIKADDIAQAVVLAHANIVDVLNQDPKVLDTVIWGVVIIDDNPF